MHTDPADVFARIRAETEPRLYLPDGSTHDPRERACNRVCQEHDDRLVLAKHELTGDWVVFIKTGRDSLYPVIGIGRELCSPEELRSRLDRADAKRHGDKLLRQINENNERIRREYRRKANDAAEETAEAFEWGFRREGVLSPKVFIPRDI